MKKPFREYYEEFCEVFGHPLWHMPMMCIGFFLFVEVMHTSFHVGAENDAHNFCSNQEWVRELKQFKENNMY
jgi:hypothetical protein